MPVDLIGADGIVEGEVASFAARAGRLDTNNMRPFIGNDGRSYVSVYVRGDRKDVKSYRAVPIGANATLHRDEWKELDTVVTKAAEFRLGGIQDLIDAGLVYSLGNAMGTTVIEWHDVTSALDAELTMDGVTRGQGGRPIYKHHYMPIPIIHADYEINARELELSRRMSNPIDTTMAERAARTCNAKLEAMLFTNTTYAFGEKDAYGRNQIYSYLNHPDRIPATLSVGWDESGKTGKQIVDEVISLKKKSMAKLHFGPWNLYIPSGYDTKLDEDYTGSNPDTNTNTTIRQRIQNIAGINKIKVIDTLPADNIILVQMTPDVVRLVRGFGLRNVEWGVEGNMVTKYKVMTIQVPQVRSDANGNSGIVHLA